MMQGQTVLQVIPDLNEGGAERTTIEVAEAIVNAGGIALVASQGGRLEGELEQVGGKLILLPLQTKNPFNLSANARRLVELINSYDVDIVHARSRAPAWSAKWATDATNAKLITTYHGAYRSNNFLKTKYNSVMASGEMVIANSSWIAEHVIRVHKIEKSKIVTIPRGVDLDLFDPQKVNAERINAIYDAWGVDSASPSTLSILLPGRFTLWKGHLLALDALNKLSRDIQRKVYLIFAGDTQTKPDYVRKIKQKIESYGLADRVRFSGFTNDMPAAYLASTIVLTPSLRPEAFGRTVAEAGAMGKPVIACDHGGAKEIIEHEVTGLTITPGNEDSLAKSIQYLVTASAEKRTTIGHAAMKRVRQYFSKHSLQKATLEVYSKLLKKGGCWK